MSVESSMQPVALRPILKQRVWGVERLPAWYPQPEPGQPVGEAWLTAEECVAEGGNATLGELAAASPQAFGADANGFPLLIKLLFPREKLSVQVHPNDAEAQALGQPARQDRVLVHRRRRAGSDGGRGAQGAVVAAAGARRDH